MSNDILEAMKTLREIASSSRNKAQTLEDKFLEKYLTAQEKEDLEFKIRVASYKDEDYVGEL